ncbi:MAG TPA: ABC transporter ATP-binding protein/permease [Myxococcota bacterium]|nr:ABC transporter ATP-binding protein/permease [Myxococcota bacterium]
MPRDRRAPVFGRRFARALWRLIRIYWVSPDAKWGAALLLGAIALELGTVWANFLLSDAERRIFDALGAKESVAFLAAMGLFLGAALLFVLVSTYRIYLRQALEIRWRRGLTAHYLERWMGAQAYVQAELHRGEVDNPEQRIQEDVRDFVSSALGLSLSLLSAVASLVSFGGLLWTLSRHFPLHLDSAEIRFPGLLLWVAIGYAAFSMWITHVVGRRLIPINFDRLRFEADFRYGLVRFRDHVEAVALARGEDAERLGGLQRFHNVVTNWWQLIRAQRNLTLLTTGIGQTNSLVPLLVAAPAYFAGHLTLGSIAQIRFAYGQVSSALTWFVSAYQEIARWRANIERLATFADVMDVTAREIEDAGIRVVPVEGSALRIADLCLEQPDGRVQFQGANATVNAGDRVAVTGPSGSGKTMLVRAIGGVWPFGSGRIEIPARARMLFVPQRPYFPLSSLRDAVSFPAPTGTFADERIREALDLLGLGHLAARLDDTEQWEQLLTPHEQQRLALARVLVHEPDWIFLDKATSALDEAMEKRVYELLAQRLPRATLVTVAHRPDVARYHTRSWTLAPGEDGRIALDAA